MASALSMGSSVPIDRVRGALWGLFAGDALAAPSHWYYGGAGQIARDYGGALKCRNQTYLLTGDFELGSESIVFVSMRSIRNGR